MRIENAKKVIVDGKEFSAENYDEFLVCPPSSENSYWNIEGYRNGELVLWLQVAGTKVVSILEEDLKNKEWEDKDKAFFKSFAIGYLESKYPKILEEIEEKYKEVE